MNIDLYYRVHSSAAGGTIYSVYEQQSGPGTIRITKKQRSFETVYPPDELDMPPPKENDGPEQVS